jgi:hypothetical protein
VVEAHDPSSLPGKLKPIGGSKSDTWNNVIANQTIQTLWRKNSNEEERKNQINAAIAGLIGINPNDELEGMLAAQLVACHNATMEFYRRAMIGEQTFEGRRENLRTSFRGLTPLSWKASIGTVARDNRKSRWNTSTSTVADKPSSATWRGGGMRTRSENQPHALGHAPGETLRSENAEREAVPVTGDGKR